MAVVDFLVKECKISDERFVVAGYGPHQPLVPNDGAANKARNRRVELVVRQDR
jgi:chemotaxis protein MotB